MLLILRPAYLEPSMDEMAIAKCRLYLEIR